MIRGGIIVDLPASALAAATWRVNTGSATGPAGEIIAADPGECLMTIEAEAEFPGVQVAASLCARVSVLPDRITRVRVPLPDVPLGIRRP